IPEDGRDLRRPSGTAERTVETAQGASSKPKPVAREAGCVKGIVEFANGDSKTRRVTCASEGTARLGLREPMRSKLALRQNHRWCMKLSSPQNDDAIGISAFRVVLNSPAVGCFREFLPVDHHEQTIEGKSRRGLPHQPFKKDFAISDLTDFKGNMPPRVNNAGKLA